MHKHVILYDGPCSVLATMDFGVIRGRPGATFRPLSFTFEMAIDDYPSNAMVMSASPGTRRAFRSMCNTLDMGPTLGVAGVYR